MEEMTKLKMDNKKVKEDIQILQAKNAYQKVFMAMQGEGAKAKDQKLFKMQMNVHNLNQKVQELEGQVEKYEKYKVVSIHVQH